MNQVEGIETLANVFKVEFENLSKQIAKCMKPKEEVHEVIQMKNDEVQVAYPPEDVNFAGGKSPIFPEGPTHLEIVDMHWRNNTLPKYRGYNHWGRDNQYGGGQNQY